MSNAERKRIVDDLMRGALVAARHDGADVLLGRHFLIVDGDRRRLARVKTALERLGGEDMLISTALTPAAAHEIIVDHEGLMDVVLIAHELGAGKDSGIDLLTRLRRSDLTGEALPVLYTRKLSRGLRVRAKAAGFEDVVAPDDLTTHVLFALARRLVEGAPDDECD